MTNINALELHDSGPGRVHQAKSPVLVTFGIHHRNQGVYKAITEGNHANNQLLFLYFCVLKLIEVAA